MAKTAKHPQYEILSAYNEWVKVTRAKVQPSGWLHAEIDYKIANGHGTETTLVRPGKWREVSETT